MSYKKQDHYYKQAKKEGYRARSSYKLKQIQKRFKILRRGDKVIDFGAAPGAWTQVSSEYVGNKGQIVAVDKNPIRPFMDKNIATLQMDIRSPRLLEYVNKELDGKVDVILSDLAGNTSGRWHLDSERQIYLATLAFEAAKSLLKISDDEGKGGHFITKVFRGDQLKEFENELKLYFEKVKNWRPPATRKQSAEEYLICMNFKGEQDDG